MTALREGLQARQCFRLCIAPNVSGDDTWRSTLANRVADMIAAKHLAGIVV